MSEQTDDCVALHPPLARYHSYEYIHAYVDNNESRWNPTFLRDNSYWQIYIFCGRTDGRVISLVRFSCFDQLTRRDDGDASGVSIQKGIFLSVENGTWNSFDLRANFDKREGGGCG